MNTYSIKKRLTLLAAASVLCGFGTLASAVEPMHVVVVERNMNTRTMPSMSTRAVVVHHVYTTESRRNCYTLQKRNIMGRSSARLVCDGDRF